MPHPTPFPPVIDSSMRSAFVACPEQWRRRYLEGWTRPGRSIHLHFGGAFAKGMEAFRNHFYRESGTIGSIDDSLSFAIECAISAWGDTDPSGNGTNKSLDRLIGALESFVSHYNPITDYAQPHRSADGRLCTEFGFAVPLPIANPSTGEPLLYSGRFDQIVSAHGALMGEDDKTTTQLGASWGNQWRLRAQFTGYVWGARAFGYPLQGFIVRGISILKGGYGHAEVIEQRPDHMIADWHQNLLIDVHRMIACWETNTWPKALDAACSAYGGCQFQDLCVAREPDRWLANYEQQPFDPLHIGEDAPA